MKINVTKHKEEYVVEKDGKQLAKVKTYRNLYHLGNCYIDFDLDNMEEMDETNIFQIISDEEKSPLQAILSSSETKKGIFLASHGFIKVRICHGMEVKKKDLLSNLDSEEIKIFKTNLGKDEYNDCCKLLFKYYKDTHEKINPLTANFDAFIQDIPTEVLYAKDNDVIQHVAFVKDNEIAYVINDKNDDEK